MELHRSQFWKWTAALFVCCVLLAALHTWPLVLAPHRYSRVDNGDYLLNAWAMSWVASTITSDPARLFDGNIFWPERRTLAYSEAMIVQGVMATPVITLGGSPVLAFSLVMLAGFVLTAFAFGLLAHRWTGSWTAAFVTASAAGFNAHLFTRLGHMQAMHVEFIALALLGLDQVFARRRVRDAVLLAAGFALQGLTSVYLMTFTTWAMIYGAGARLATAASGSRRRVVILLALAGVLAILMLAFYLYPYYRLHVDSQFARSAADNQGLAGSYTDYLSTVSHLHYWWSRRFVDVSASINFPGITVMLLVAAGLATRGIRQSPQALMCAAVAAGCALTSMVPRLPGYAAIHDWVPLFWAVRVQAHMGQVVLLLLALLAGFGTLRVRQEWGARRGWWAIAALLVVAINAEALRAPIPWRVFTGIPRVYDVLAAEPRAVVAELPLYEPAAIFANAPYVFNSTRYLQPLLNGYSGYTPPSYVRTWAALKTFPQSDALDALRARGVTHIVVHRGDFIGRHGRAAFRSIGSTASLRRIASEGDIDVYRFR